MRKIDEARLSGSCLNRAKDDELIFVLLGRDSAAPETIRFWANQRVKLGKNRLTDEQILEAFRCADKMECERKQHARMREGKR